ncbi:GntR family transcriptional regulator [Anaerococcus sp. AGMB00486]|uniref:GntR family transcriptional regulator n=1 Tax=Anaerococcus faecalis TaxID=2742993 RepID=A0ABX2NCM4_9FIRM|nr:GntR family transcriptional regulator [Anaerococcus faecalis]NVF12421.1 GntR family transcriptional regulator [Anaerococcus faecalis]
MATINTEDNLRNKARKYILDEIENLISRKQNKLPSEKDMANKFGISRVTLRSALSDLEREGKINRIQGKGTFVSPNYKNMKIDLFRMKTYGDIIEDLGYKQKITSIKTKIIDTPDWIKNDIFGKNGKLIISARAFYADNKIAVICLDFLPIYFKNDLEYIKSYNDSLFNFYKEKYNIRISSDSIEFHAVEPEDIKKVLDIDDKFLPNKCILLRGFEYDDKGKAVLYTMEYVDTDYIPISTIRYR